MALWVGVPTDGPAPCAVRRTGSSGIRRSVVRMNRLRRAAASGAVIAATLAGTVVATAGTANAASVEYISPQQCRKASVSVETLENGWPGQYLCGGKFSQRTPIYKFDDGTEQMFFVGADYAVWTMWLAPNGTRSSIVSLGGRVKGDPWVNAYNGGFIQLEVMGTDDRHWFNNRDVGGGWTGWFR
ncbi:hypothetical protein PUR61_29640 [Streptomyces sp. BE20]|uniref:hypothetical protein n=1 Tax=Streptomyces sp. BE20 TaxID=3002525 RepID=UPI002E79D1D9|nr:hypothetical protein [Streptomyces sp. BE20]MEE1826317.1 hypothetical protein [Streptomyces sp. BE20]